MLSVCRRIIGILLDVCAGVLRVMLSVKTQLFEDARCQSTAGAAVYAILAFDGRVKTKKRCSHFVAVSDEFDSKSSRKQSIDSWRRSMKCTAWKDRDQQTGAAAELNQNAFQMNDRTSTSLNSAPLIKTFGLTARLKYVFTDCVRSTVEYRP